MSASLDWVGSYLGYGGSKLRTRMLAVVLVAAVVSCLVTLLLFYVISWPAETAGPTMAAVLKYLSLTEHFSEMVRGVIETKDVIYFLSVIVLALFLTHRSVESVRWR